MRPLRTLIPHRISFFSVMKHYHFTTNHPINNRVFYTSGDHSEGVPPVPIPNTEVKPFSADGTAVWWESRSSPDVFLCPDGIKKRMGTPSTRYAACGARAGQVIAVERQPLPGPFHAPGAEPEHTPRTPFRRSHRSASSIVGWRGEYRAYVSRSSSSNPIVRSNPGTTILENQYAIATAESCSSLHIHDPAVDTAAPARKFATRSGSIEPGASTRKLACCVFEM